MHPERPEVNTLRLRLERASARDLEVTAGVSQGRIRRIRQGREWPDRQTYRAIRDGLERLG